MISQQSEGIPRNINKLCFHALSLGCALNQKVINASVMNEVFTDLKLKLKLRPRILESVADLTRRQKIRHNPKINGRSLRVILRWC